MTRCKHCSYNYQLKSSVYNQTGQSYEVQLASYNCMTNHLRRILLAKSIVDSGELDKRNSNKSSKDKNCRFKSIKFPSQSLSDRFAYETRRHPHEVANMSWRASDHSCGKYNGSSKERRSNSTDSSEDSSLRDHRSSIKSYRDKFGSGSVNCGQINAPNNSPKEIHRIDNSEGSDDFGVSKKSEKLKSVKHEGDRRRDCGTSSRELSCLGTPEFIDSNLIINSDKFQSESSMYVKFVYDITKEVMDRGFYSDNEIQRVFDKHFQRNLGRLNKDKMTREINSLKRSLNMNYDSDKEDETETGGSDDCQFPLNSVHSLITKPRSSFSNLKKTDKIVEHEVHLSNKRCPEDVENRKIKEIIVSKEDIITTLLEMNLELEKAKEICKNLENKSKEDKRELSNANADEEESNFGAPSGSSGLSSKSKKKEEKVLKSSAKDSRNDISGELDCERESEKDKLQEIGKTRVKESSDTIANEADLSIPNSNQDLEIRNDSKSDKRSFIPPPLEKEMNNSDPKSNNVIKKPKEIDAKELKDDEMGKDSDVQSLR